MSKFSGCTFDGAFVKLADGGWDAQDLADYASLGFPQDMPRDATPDDLIEFYLEPYIPEDAKEEIDWVVVRQCIQERLDDHFCGR